MKKINLSLFHSGKIRDTYHIPGYPDLLLVVASDRLSTHNIVHKSLIPLKGLILTAVTVFWMKKILERHKIPHHIVAYGKDIYSWLPKDIQQNGDLHLRALIIKKLKMVKVEFIWRHYLTGSLYKNYYIKGLKNPYGISIPDDLKNMSFLKKPIFTPTDKSATDVPLISYTISDRFFKEYMLTQQTYTLCRDYALTRNIDIVDTKLECGEESIGDEIITPDSSRFVRVADIKEDENPPWMDKEIFRQDAEKRWGDGPKVPLEFSREIIKKGEYAYLELLKALTGTNAHDILR